MIRIAKMTLGVVDEKMDVYEKLKCNKCGKLLGYVLISVKTFPPKSLYRFLAGFPYQKTTVDRLCEECFFERKSERQ